MSVDKGNDRKTVLTIIKDCHQNQTFSSHLVQQDIHLVSEQLEFQMVQDVDPISDAEIKLEEFNYDHSTESDEDSYIELEIEDNSSSLKSHHESYNLSQCLEQKHINQSLSNHIKKEFDIEFQAVTENMHKIPIEHIKMEKVSEFDEYHSVSEPQKYESVLKTENNAMPQIDKTCIEHLISEESLVVRKDDNKISDINYISDSEEQNSDIEIKIEKIDCIDVSSESDENSDYVEIEIEHDSDCQDEEVDSSATFQLNIVNIKKENFELEPLQIKDEPDSESVASMDQTDIGDFTSSAPTLTTMSSDRFEICGKVIIISILPFIIQQYKKYEILWKADDIAYDIKTKKYEIYAKIAETLKMERNKIISLEAVNYHINYLNKLYSINKKWEMNCEKKGKEFIPEYGYYKELSFLSQSQGPFLCSICNEILPRYHSYCQHMAQHNNTQPYKCPLCDAKFAEYRHYQSHKKRHLGIFDHHCKVCGKGYIYKADLKYHETSHSGDKPFMCLICGATFRARCQYRNHVRRHEQQFRHECYICKKGFNELPNLRTHVKLHLNIRDVICKICGKDFVHQRYLKNHELIHGDEKRFKCNDCEMAFFQPGTLQKHRKKHHS